MPKRILVIDDDAAIGEVLRLMLEGVGYEVGTQTNGHAAEVLAEPFPDLLFLDIRISGFDGRAICRQLKSQESTCHIPIILLSAHQDAQRIARESEADDFLAKPFQMESVLSLAAKYLGST